MFRCANSFKALFVAATDYLVSLAFLALCIWYHFNCMHTNTHTHTHAHEQAHANAHTHRQIDRQTRTRTCSLPLMQTYLIFLSLCI